MPEYDAREYHRIPVFAAPDEIYEALRTADLASSAIVRLLLAARALPGALLNGRDGLRMLRERARSPMRLHDFERQGFSVLAEDPPCELLIGLEGRFWRATGKLRSIDASTFSSRPPPESARAVWNFYIRPEPDGSCTLSTETRVRCADAGARRRFRAYWLLVRPGSGLIRRMMLRAIRRASEGTFTV